MLSRDIKRVRFGIIAGAVILLVGGGLYWAREKFGGLRNVFSSKYWHDRETGEDLWDAKESIFKRGNRDFPDVLLTIDDGPHPQSLPLILDTLKKYRIHATFFMVGKQVKKYPELARRAIAEGNEVGNHTQDHLRLDSLNEKQIRAEIVDCDKNIALATGHGTKLMRPPGMRFNPEVLKVVHEMGYTCVDWNVAAKDFVPPIDKKDPTQHERVMENLDPSLIADRVVEKVQNGSIILLHDIPATADALPRIIEQLQAKGFHFKSSSEMLAELPQHVAVVSNPVEHVPVLTAQRNPHVTNPMKPKGLSTVR